MAQPEKIDKDFLLLSCQFINSETARKALNAMFQMLICWWKAILDQIKGHVVKNIPKEKYKFTSHAGY